jgi:hypothetical protein
MVERQTARTLLDKIKQLMKTVANCLKNQTVSISFH